jgi:hypothetical protein
VDNDVDLEKISIAVVLKGDVNMNGVVDGRDAFQIQRYAAGARALDSLQLIVSDVNQTSDVNGRDAFQIQRLAAGARGDFDW